MAQQQHGAVLDQEQFCCSICLDLLKEPVTLHCGHSYCRSCIEGCWDQQYKDSRVCSCPQCRETFIPRPVLRKNNILAGVVENLRQSSARPPEEKCSRHNEPIKVYCRTDQQCICILCAMDEHKGHDTVSVLAERAVKEKQVMKSKRELQKKIQERKKELKDLNQSTETLKSSAETSVDATDKIFREMMASVERRRSEVKELIRDQEKTAVAHAERLQRQMEEEIARLERRNADLEELSNTDDIHFIQSFRSLSMSTASPVLTSIVLGPLTSFTDVSDAVSGLRDKLEDILKTTWPLMSDRGTADMRTNLLKNPNGEEQMESWDLTKNGGSQWRVEKLPGDCGYNFCGDGVNKYFVTSFQLCLKRQVIDLQAEGYSPCSLDAQPPVTVEDWYCGRTDCGCTYEITVCLLDENKRVLQKFQPGTVTLNPARDRSWKQVRHTFRRYGRGLRFISFEHGGQGTKAWRGWYGVRVTGSSVTIEA